MHLRILQRCKSSLSWLAMWYTLTQQYGNSPKILSKLVYGFCFQTQTFTRVFFFLLENCQGNIYYRQISHKYVT